MKCEVLPSTKGAQPTGNMQSPKGTFFILASPRSGSTWLQQTLDAHPKLTCLYEPSNLHANRAFHWLTLLLTTAVAAGDRDAVRDRILSRLPFRYAYSLSRLDSALARSQTQMVGAKIVLPNLFAHIDFTTFFMNYRDARVILLDRESATDALCSWSVARRTRLWHSDIRQHGKIAPFTIDERLAISHIHTHLLQHKVALGMLRHLDTSFISLTYEHLMSHTEQTLEHIGSFLDVEGFEVRSCLTKLMVRPYRDIITNYDAILDIEALARRKIASHLT